jgi:hypothetical protein
LAFGNHIKQNIFNKTCVFYTKNNMQCVIIKACMNNLDALTLQLLTSKKVYNNYLSTTDKDAAQKTQLYKDFVLNNQQRIKETISIYLKDPFAQITTELDENMENLLKALWQHFETLDREAKQRCDENDDEFDTMFYEKQMVTPVQQSNYSYFGKKIEKMHGTLDAFMAPTAPTFMAPTAPTVMAPAPLDFDEDE